MIIFNHNKNVHYHGIIVGMTGNHSQEHIKPAREHVTTIDGEFKHGCQILILVTSKYGKAAMYTCIPVFARVDRGFNPIQQQPSHHSRQQRATHLHVPFFWTKITWTYSVEDWGCP